MASAVNASQLIFHKILRVKLKQNVKNSIDKKKKYDILKSVIITVIAD